MSREKSSGSKSDEPEKKTPAGTKKHRSSEASAAAAALAATEKQRRQKRAAGVSDSDERNPNPVWFKPLMFGFMLLGLIWIVLYYVTSAGMQLPVPALGQANIFVGFGLVLVGVLMTPWWK